MAIKPLTLLDGTTAYAVDVEAEFLPLYTDIAPNNVQPLNKLGTGRFVLETALAAFGELPAVGTIIPFYDFNGLLTFDATKWAYCNGQVINVGTIGLQTLPDLSGRYLVGFGTDGGGNIGTAAWATPPVGNPGNTTNSSHTHDMANHQHGVGTLSFTDAGHTHTPGTLAFQTMQFINSGGGTGQVRVWDNAGVAFLAAGQNICGGAGNPALTYNDFGGGGAIPARPYNCYTNPAASIGATGSGTAIIGGGAGNTGNPNPNTTGAGGLAALNIQPISIRVRFIMRIQ